MHRALLLVLLGSSAPALASGVALEYAVNYGPLQVLEVRTTARLDEAGYVASSEMRTVGLAGVLFPWTAGATTTGARSAGGLRPISHRARGEYRGAQRTVEIDYGADGPVRAEIAPPPEADHRDAVPVADRRATIDPLTATLAAVEAGCRGTLRIFDGRRRYDLALSDQGETDLPESTPAYSGRARHCRARVVPGAGFWRVAAQHDERPSQIDLWIASPSPDLGPVPVYMRLSSPRGTLGIELSAVSRLP